MPKPRQERLVNFSFGMSELQAARLEVLKRVTHKGKARIMREALDFYFAHYRIGDDTLGQAEARLLDRKQSEP